MIHTSYPIFVILSVTSLWYLSMFITMADDLDKLLVQLNGTSNIDVSDDLDKLLVNLNVDRDQIKVSPPLLPSFLLFKPFSYSSSSLFIDLNVDRDYIKVLPFSPFLYYLLPPLLFHLA